MNTDLVRQEARLLAIENMVMHVYNSLLMMHNVSEDDIEKIKRHSLELAEQNTFDNVDPVMSDHASAELRDALANLLNEAKEMRNT